MKTILIIALSSLLMGCAPSPAPSQYVARQAKPNTEAKHALLFRADLHELEHGWERPPVAEAVYVIPHEDMQSRCYSHSKRHLGSPLRTREFPLKEVSPGIYEGKIFADGLKDEAYFQEKLCAWKLLNVNVFAKRNDGVVLREGVWSSLTPTLPATQSIFFRRMEVQSSKSVFSSPADGPVQQSTPIEITLSLSALDPNFSVDQEFERRKLSSSVEKK